MVSEASRPPILKQARRESVAVVTGFEIAVVHQDAERVGDAAGCVVDYPGIQPFKATARAWRECLLGGRLGEDIHGDAVSLIVQPLPETGLVMNQVTLPPRPEQLGAIDLADVRHRHLIESLHDGGVPQVCEEGLHVMGDTNAECFVDGVGTPASIGKP